MYSSIKYVSSEVYSETKLILWKEAIILVARSVFIGGSFQRGAAAVVCKIYSLYSTFMFSFHEKSRKI